MPNVVRERRLVAQFIPIQLVHGIAKLVCAAEFADDFIQGAVV
jgi:hypothetical protein